MYRLSSVAKCRRFLGSVATYFGDTSESKSTKKIRGIVSIIVYISYIFNIIIIFINNLIILFLSKCRHCRHYFQFFMQLYILIKYEVTYFIKKSGDSGDTWPFDYIKQGFLGWRHFFDTWRHFQKVATLGEVADG